VRRLTIALLLVLTVAATVARASGARDERRAVGAGVSIRVPTGWHVVHQRLSEVVDPIPRLMVATFAVSLSHRSCVCGMPNIRDFPRDGGLLFVWEYPSLPARALRAFPRRPRRFRVSATAIGAAACAGPSDVVVFRQARRAFQAEIYLGPTAGRAVRARLTEILDSLRATPGPIPPPPR
jgi:hypothetical protein